MNMNRLINMAMKMVMGIVIKKGVDGAINVASRMGAGKKADPSLSPQEQAALTRANEQKAKTLGKRMKDIQKIIRRLR